MGVLFYYLCMIRVLHFVTFIRIYSGLYSCHFVFFFLAFHIFIGMCFGVTYIYYIPCCFCAFIKIKYSPILSVIKAPLFCVLYRYAVCSIIKKKIVCLEIFYWFLFSLHLLFGWAYHAFTI